MTPRAVSWSITISMKRICGVVRLRLERNSEKTSCAVAAVHSHHAPHKMCQGGSVAPGQEARQQRLAVVLADLSQCLLEPSQVGGRERLVGPEAMDHDVVEMILQVFLHLLLVLDPGHLRQVFGDALAHGRDLVLEVGVDDRARLLVQEGHQTTQAQAQFLETVQGDAFPECALLH